MNILEKLKLKWACRKLRRELGFMYTEHKSDKELLEAIGVASPATLRRRQVMR